MIDVCSGISRTCCQDCFCGRGKVEQNSDINKVLGMRFCPDVQDAMLAMDFSTPYIEATVSRPVSGACWTAVSPLSRRPTVWDCDLSVIHVNHATVGRLSASMPALENRISASLCITNYCNRTDIISKSEFFRQPCGL